MTHFLVIFPKNKDAEKMLIKLMTSNSLEAAKKRLSRFKLSLGIFINLKPVRLILVTESPALLTITKRLIEAKIPTNILNFKEFKNKDEAFDYGGRN